VAFSRVIAEPRGATIRWKPHGTYGRSMTKVNSRPSWTVPLDGYTEIETPVTLEDLRAVEPELRRIEDQLRRQIGGARYSPFVFSSKRPMRPMQGYLVKMPVEILEAVPGLQVALQAPPASEPPQPAPGGGRGGKKKRGEDSGAGRQQDLAVRLAIEAHSMRWAQDHLESLGYDVVDVSRTEPYDLLAAYGEEMFAVEVKGSAGTATTVELTSGEVDRTLSPDAPTVLIVVDQIEWRRSSDGSIETSGGRPRVWREWRPANERLTPTRYRYLLPSGGQVRG
jgi:hypothetical protein